MTRTPTSDAGGCDHPAGDVATYDDRLGRLARDAVAWAYMNLFGPVPIPEDVRQRVAQRVLDVLREEFPNRE